MSEETAMPQKRPKSVVAAFALTVLLLSGGLAAINPPRQKIPEFSGKTLDGQKFTSASLKGRPVLIQFWATWCPMCRKDQAAVDTLAREFEGKGLVVLAVNVGETKRKVTDYLEKSPRACNIILQEDTDLASIVRPPAFPLYVVLDADGGIAGAQSGAGGEAALRQLLGKAGL
jgi:thiol-disulfide isomerase/thioredoxin